MTVTGGKLVEVYDRAFYSAQVEGSARSASVVVPLLRQIFPEARSIVDVGCGTGVWLEHFKRLGFTRVMGVDGGDASEGLLQISKEEFRRTDLSRPLRLGERFDLCMCLEVAEHVPESSAECLVRSLCELSDVVVFGAAIPGQGGTQHVNERWGSYWISLFESMGYVCFDVLRPRIWYDERVEWWYAQNTLVFATGSSENSLAALRSAADTVGRLVDVVHPRCFGVFREAAEPAGALQGEIARLRADPHGSEKERLVAQTDAAARVAEILRGELSDERAGAMQLRAELAEARREGARLAGELETIRGSTSWRLTWPARRVLGGWPRTARALRRALTVMWWTATFQLPRRLRLWRERSEGGEGRRPA